MYVGVPGLWDSDNRARVPTQGGATQGARPRGREEEVSAMASHGGVNKGRRQGEMEQTSAGVAQAEIEEVAG
jgi:hypothetical protein